ncbi:MAG: NAD-dependent epimerase/dehydratase family protein [Verrucomicrobiota bacterium]
MIKQEVLDSFKGKKIVITGGTGLIGRQVVKFMCDAGAQVRIISLDKVQVDSRAEHVYGDLTSFEFCKEATKGMDFAFHMAGVKGSMEVSKTMLASHFVPTLMINTNMLEACRVNGIAKLVYTSSIGAYADGDIFREGEGDDKPPMDFAGWAKRMGELQIHAYKTQHGIKNFAIVRLANTYGPGDNFDPANAMVVASLMGRIRRGEKPLKVWGDGKAERDFLFSRDAAEGIILALHHGTDGSYINIGSGRGTSVRDLVETLKKFIDFEYEFDTTKPSGAPKKMLDIARARERLGYNPSTTLEQGLRETWEWFLQNEKEYLNKLNYFK